MLASLALIPLAWLIGEATEHASHHTGAGIGGFLNATFGNAPELIIALIAVNEGLTEVVRGSLTGSVVGNLLLVLGFSLALGGHGRSRPPVDLHVARARRAGCRRVPHPVDSRLGRRPRPPLAGRPVAARVDRAAGRLRRRDVAVAATPPRAARVRRGSGDGRHGPSARRCSCSAPQRSSRPSSPRSSSARSRSFAETLGVSDFFVAAVIVAIVGNAAEHGGAVVIARRGNIKLAAEIALASSAQVAVFLIPAVAIISWAIEPLSLAFRPVELGVLAAATAADGDPPPRRPVDEHEGHRAHRRLRAGGARVPTRRRPRPLASATREGARNASTAAATFRRGLERRVGLRRSPSQRPRPRHRGTSRGGELLAGATPRARPRTRCARSPPPS